jgi:hypothetical protein
MNKAILKDIILFISKSLIYNLIKRKLQSYRTIKKELLIVSIVKGKVVNQIISLTK